MRSSRRGGPNREGEMADSNIPWPHLPRVPCEELHAVEVLLLLVQLRRDASLLAVNPAVSEVQGWNVLQENHGRLRA